MLPSIPCLGVLVMAARDLDLVRCELSLLRAPVALVLRDELDGFLLNDARRDENLLLALRKMPPGLAWWDEARLVGGGC